MSSRVSGYTREVMQTPIDPLDIQKNKDMAAIGYVWILSVAVWAARRDSPFVRYHVRQGLALFFLSLLMPLIPVLGKPLLLLVLAGMLVGFVHAGRGEVRGVPIVEELVHGTLTFGVLRSYVRKAMDAIRRFFGRK